MSGGPQGSSTGGVQQSPNVQQLLATLLPGGPAAPQQVQQGWQATPGRPLTPPQNFGWTPAFQGVPQASANNRAIYPQLSGGYWNQMSQMLAGPNYQPLQNGQPVGPQPGITQASLPQPKPAPATIASQPASTVWAYGGNPYGRLL